MTYDFSTLRFKDVNTGRAIESERFDEISNSRTDEAKIAASSTLRRGVFLNTLLSERSPEGRQAILDHIERRLLTKESLEAAQLNKIFYSKKSQTPAKVGVFIAFNIKFMVLRGFLWS